MNPASIYVFTQYISDSGYEIVKGEDHLAYITPKGNSLSPKNNISEDYPALFIEFAGLANIKGTECLIKFANKYGLLNPPIEHRSMTSGVVNFTLDTPRESTLLWSSECLIMKFLLDEWQNFIHEKPVNISLKSNISILPGIKPYLDLLQNRGELPYFSLTDDTHLNLKFFIQEILNLKLKEYPVTPCLLFDERNNLIQYFRPISLLSLMWFQFFQYISGEQKIKQCPICKEWFNVSDYSQEARWNNRCPICANRLRVQKTSVKKRYLSGMSIDEIIKRTRKTDPDIIREWIQEWDSEKTSSK